MTDYLILLLSTDWFFPYWSVLGMRVADEKRATVRTGCREIVVAMMNGVEHYYLIDFSPERQEKTATEFSNLLDGLGLGTICKDVVTEWANLNQSELKAAWLFTRLTRDLFSGDLADGRPSLEFTIRTEAARAMEESNPEQIDFVDACLRSKTAWDEFSRALEPGLPDLLPEILISVLREHRFNDFWNRICGRISTSQREALLSWYREMARFRKERSDLIPNCVNIG